MDNHFKSDAYPKNLDIVRRRFPSVYAEIKNEDFRFLHPLEVVSDQTHQPNVIITLADMPYLDQKPRFPD